MDKGLLEKLNNADHSLILKVVLIAVLIVFLAAVYRANDAKNVPMKEIEGALKKNTDIAGLKKCNTRELLEYMGIDYSKYDEVLYYKSKEALDVTEILVVKANERNDLEEVQDMIENRVSSQISTYRDYGPRQVAELKNADILKRGKYMFYAVAADPEKYEEVVRDVIQ